MRKKKYIILEKITKLKENKYCADCKKNQISFASIKFGVFLCKKCSLYHINLGNRISLIKSIINPKDWTYEIIKLFAQINNNIVNNYWEYKLKKNKNKNKMSVQEIGLLDFINNKYIHKIWVKKSEYPPMERKIISYDIDLDKLNEDINNLFVGDNISINNSKEPFPFFEKNNLLEIFNSKYSYVNYEENEKLKEEIENMIDEIETKKFKILEKERIEKEREEKERLEKERLERERIEKEREEKERLEKERNEKERQEKERVERERIEKEIQEKERLEKEKIKIRERILNEILEKEKLIEKERKKAEINKMIREINEKYEYIKNDLPEPFYLDEKKLEKLKNSDNDKCLICLEEFKIKNQVLYLPCLHLFHSRCIVRWLLDKNTCPICLSNYNGNVEKKEEKQSFNDYLEEYNSINNNDNINGPHFFNYYYNTNYFANNINNINYMYSPNFNMIINNNNIYTANNYKNINYKMCIPKINMDLNYNNMYIPNNNMIITNRNDIYCNMRVNWRGERGRGRGNYRGGAKGNNKRNDRGNHKERKVK